MKNFINISDLSKNLRPTQSNQMSFGESQKEDKRLRTLQNSKITEMPEEFKKTLLK